MEILSAAILGIVQGLTEFLPISSSAHLILVPWLLGWRPEGLAFDVSLHVGTAIAVVAFFFNDWLRLGREVAAGLRRGSPFATPSQKLFWFLVIGTLPAAISGLAFEKFIEARLRSPLVIVFTLSGLALLLYWAEKRSRQHRSLNQLTWADALWIGFSQAIALIPGVSRSGVTITTAMFRNCDRTSAARFSFLLSTPVIAGAAMLQSWRLCAAIGSSGNGVPVVNWAAMTAGTLCAAITGFLCIRFFLKYLQANSFRPFIIYRLALALIILVYYMRYL